MKEAEKQEPWRRSWINTVGDLVVWDRFKPLALGILFLTGGFMLSPHLLRSYNEGRPLPIQLSIWCGMLFLAGVPMFLFGLVHAWYGDSGNKSDGA